MSLKKQQALFCKYNYFLFLYLFLLIYDLALQSYFLSLDAKVGIVSAAWHGFQKQLGKIYSLRQVTRSLTLYSFVKDEVENKQSQDLVRRFRGVKNATLHP